MQKTTTIHFFWSPTPRGPKDHRKTKEAQPGAQSTQGERQTGKKKNQHPRTYPTSSATSATGSHADCGHLVLSACWAGPVSRLSACSPSDFCFWTCLGQRSQRGQHLLLQLPHHDGLIHRTEQRSLGPRKVQGQVYLLLHIVR